MSIQMPHKHNQILCSVFVFSMSAYQRKSQEEEKTARLEQRRSRLRAMLQEEEQRHDAELKELMADRRALEGQRLQEKEAIRSAREDRRKKVWQIFRPAKTLHCPQGITFIFPPHLSTARWRAAERLLGGKQLRGAKGEQV